MQGISNDFNLREKNCTWCKLTETAAAAFVIWIKSLVEINPCIQSLQDT